ncbi:MAG: threonine synthase, partial [Lachnospiraceae bacterium]|nr:threonine synthase [Lachnospiraceae bacterium]
IDTHPAVASCVYGKDRKETGDTKPTVLASTASPFKFTRSVMAAIDTKYEESEDFELADMLSQISKVKMPKAIEEIRTAPVLHNHLCEKDEMKQAVLEFLSK